MINLGISNKVWKEYKFYFIALAISPLVFKVFMYSGFERAVVKALNQPSTLDEVSVIINKQTKPSATFDIVNASEFQIQDIEVTCNFIAPSGTLINEQDFTIYETVNAKSIRTSKPIPLKIPSQTESIQCNVTDIDKEEPKYAAKSNELTDLEKATKALFNEYVASEVVGTWDCTTDFSSEDVNYKIRESLTYEKPSGFNSFKQIISSNTKNEKHKVVLASKGDWTLDSNILKLNIQSTKVVNFSSTPPELFKVLEKLESITGSRWNNYKIQKLTNKELTFLNTQNMQTSTCVYNNWN